MIKIGDVLDGKYKILNKIGQGGMSTVYLAINEKANKTWAVKEVRKQGHENFGIVHKSLIMEVEMLKKLSHPNLPSIIDVIDAKDDFFIVMDYIDGRTLEEIVKERKRLSQDEVISIAHQLGSVLNYLHSQKPAIIYRDLKPSNIMVKSDGTVVLIDFGTAREYKAQKLEDTTCLGTRGYAAPEQFGGMGQTDQRTDIYSLGVTMYYLITGKNPVLPPYEIYPIRRWDESLSSGLEHIILKCVNINPEERYQSVKEFSYDLENYKNYDIETIKKYRIKIRIIRTLLIASVFLFTLGSIGIIHYKELLKNSYEQMLSNAKKSTNEKEIFKYINSAIEISPERNEAYELLYEYIQEDGIFSLDEEKEIVTIAMSDNNYLEIWKNNNMESYADFCFAIGNAYWFYYEHNENRQTHAINWYEEAKEIYEEKKDKEIKKNRCELFIEIGGFYKKVITAQTEGEDAGMYKDYWNKLKDLKAINDRMPDRDLITLRLYSEIILNSVEYASYLKEDGIEKDEIIELWKDINERTDMISVNSKAANNEGNKIRELMKEGRVIIESTYYI